MPDRHDDEMNDLYFLSHSHYYTSCAYLILSSQTPFSHGSNDVASCVCFALVLVVNGLAMNSVMCIFQGKSKCEKEKQSVIETFRVIDGKRIPLLGAFVPRCKENGDYADVQCHEMNCWCVDRNGTKIKGTEASFSKPNCTKG